MFNNIIKILILATTLVSLGTVSCIAEEVPAV